jgi:hypothetical protein
MSRRMYQRVGLRWGPVTAHPAQESQQAGESAEEDRVMTSEREHSARADAWPRDLTHLVGMHVFDVLSIIARVSQVLTKEAKCALASVGNTGLDSTNPPSSSAHDNTSGTQGNYSLTFLACSMAAPRCGCPSA